MPLLIFILFWFKLDIKDFILDSNYIQVTRVEKSFSEKSGLNYRNHTGVKYYECNECRGKPLILVHILCYTREFMLERRKKECFGCGESSAAGQMSLITREPTPDYLCGHSINMET